MWHFLKLIARGFLQVLRFPPLVHQFNGSANKINAISTLSNLIVELSLCTKWQVTRYSGMLLGRYIASKQQLEGHFQGVSLNRSGAASCGFTYTQSIGWEQPEVVLLRPSSIGWGQPHVVLLTPSPLVGSSLKWFYLGPAPLVGGSLMWFYLHPVHWLGAASSGFT